MPSCAAASCSHPESDGRPSARPRSWRRMLVKRTIPGLATAVILAPLLIGCGSDTPTPAPTATPEAVAAAPVLTALKPVVEFRNKETEAGTMLEADEAVDVEPGANILTREGGRATLAWDGFLTHELLTDTDTLVSLSKPETRYAILDQATGTGRYTLLGAGEPATLTVKARWVTVDVTSGAADFIVSLVPGSEPSAWLAVLEGTAQVRRVDGADAADEAEVVTLTAGQAAGFGEAGALSTPRDIDAAVVKAWYDDAAEGEAETSIVGVAYRCEVTADDTPFLSEADAEAEAVGDPLSEGTIVEAIQRDDAAEWLRVRPIAQAETGWVSVENLDCSGPAGSVSLTAPGETGEPTATVLLPTRALPTRGTPTVALAGTTTPTPSPTPAAFTADFSAGDDEIDAGDCTTLRWTVRGVKAYYVNGEGKAGETGGTTVCPDETTTYTLRVVKQDGTEETRSVKVKVREKEATDTPAPTQAQATQAPATNTAVPAQPPTTVPPTTAPPTTEPPTTAPPTTEPPTTEPPTAPAPPAGVRR